MTGTAAAGLTAPGAGARIGAAMPWLLVPLLMLAGLLAMTVQAMPGEGETLAALLADPGLWPLRAPAALEAVLASWVTLTLAGLAMGMMVFLMASGLTLIFGLMDVINFGHGAFVSLGAFVGVSVLAALAGWMAAPSLPLNLAAVGAAVLAAMAVTGAAGYAFERVIVRPVYGAHLKQILVTVGGLIIAEQLIYVIWGPAEIYISRPEMLKGAMVFGGVALETYRLLAVAVGLAVFAVMGAVLRLTRIGLIVRAGVQDGEMVEALGYRLRRVFIGVFVTGSALAGLGGVLWALYQEVVTAHMGADLMVLVFVVVIIGGLGSVTGCFLGALMIGLVQNYTAFVEPKLALVSTIAVLVLVLMWRPTGMLARDRGRQS
ncbi:branched-chain amino acid ABC transporter permease [Meridianimarinicoccus roseus]|nr:branched-chain amino acid ABC transporter permease [Meridianimarinicoccus roseus]